MLSRGKALKNLKRRLFGPVNVLSACYYQTTDLIKNASKGHVMLITGGLLK